MNIVSDSEDEPEEITEEIDFIDDDGFNIREVVAALLHETDEDIARILRSIIHHYNLTHN